MGILINIDNGGTFTDVCLRNGDSVVHAKAPTTPHDLTQCFVTVLTRAAHEFYGEEDLARLVRETEYLRYSTTSGTNAVVERKGTPIALVVSQGEESTLYGAGARLADDPLWNSMVPNTPVGLTVGTEGEIDVAELTAVVNRILESGAQRLVFSLADEVAERNVKEALLDSFPRHLLGAVPFLISHELVRDHDHARRTLSAVLNSYLHPSMEHFLYGAEKVCKQNHLARPLLIYRNDGDSARVAKTTALKSWGSGPRGGVEGAIAYAGLYGIDTLVAMDIGGTTTDVSVVCDGKVRLNAFGSVEAMATSFPMPEMHSFGLGGSSVVCVIDGQLKIGPDSVGAAPGPACFGRGGTHVTLTDALLLAGVIDGENYLGGELKLDAQRATNAIEKQIAGPLGLSLDAAVMAVIEGFEQQVARRLREALASLGRDPAEATLLAFGGGGPMIATGIAGATGMRRVLVPHMSAVFSAFGIGFSNLAHEYQAPLGNGNDEDLAALRESMLVRARHDMFGEGVDQNACAYDYLLWSAVDGQAVEKPLNGAAPEFDPAASEHRLVLKATYHLPAFTLAADDGATRPAGNPDAHAHVRTAADSAENVPVYLTDELEAGAAFAGPALLRSPYLTCLLGPGWSLRATRNGDYMIEVA